ncbi:hypothetical protein PV325_001217 [Microctonus aethiopoides]|uniref:Uncharacterized protein n=1 Tax=Microctonus aethiopoides TaxID=144406 RepID=A0AA39F8T3_9HYME|nr:hypothetical protein PV325_001217 [Microctonus aethiopoides]KAK0165082.1 hypothetical protein PV328_003634 [Microctonus aethiopoides]
MSNNCGRVDDDDMKNKIVLEKNGDSEKLIINNYSSSNINEDVNDELTLEDLAPDGGWGWMIALSMTIVFVTTSCASPSFTIVFGEFFESTGQAGSATTMLNSVFMVSFSLSGLLTNALVKKYPIRVVGVSAALIFSMPNIITAFVTHVYQLAVIFFIQGIGLGLMNTICSANFNAYFVRKRAEVMSAAQIIIGLGGIVYPIMIEKMMSAYGFRATAALIGALSLNSIVGMMMMHPVQWHLKDPNEVREKRRQLNESKLKLSKQLSNQNNKNHIIATTDRRSTIHGTQNIMNEPNRWCSLGNLKEDMGHEQPLLIAALKKRVGSHLDVENGIRPRSKSGTTRMALTNPLSTLSASSLGNIVGAVAEAQHQIEILSKPSNKDKIKQLESVELTDKKDDEKNLLTKKISISENNHEESLTGNILKMLADFFELSLLKDRTFMIMSLGISFVFVSDFTFASLLPLAMIHSGYTNSDTALTITIGAAAELSSRVMFAIFTLLVNVRAKTIFFYAMIVMGFAKFTFFYFGESLTGIMICMAAIGMVRSYLFVPQPLVVVENYPVEMYTACYGIFTLVNGIVIIIFGPLVGLIKDITNSFAIGQLVLIAINCAFVVPWGWELIVEHRKKREERKSIIKY